MESCLSYGPTTLNPGRSAVLASDTAEGDARTTVRRRFRNDARLKRLLRQPPTPLPSTDSATPRCRYSPDPLTLGVRRKEGRGGGNCLLKSPGGRGAALGLTPSLQLVFSLFFWAGVISECFIVFLRRIRRRGAMQASDPKKSVSLACVRCTANKTLQANRKGVPPLRAFVYAVANVPGLLKGWEGLRGACVDVCVCSCLLCIYAPVCG